MLFTFTVLKYIVVCIGPDALPPAPQLFFILPFVHSVNTQFLQTCHASGTWECKPYEPCPPASQYLEEDGPEITEEEPKGSLLEEVASTVPKTVKGKLDR